MKTTANIQEALRNAKHALAESDSAVNDITRIVNNFEGSEGKKRPFYIYCSESGAKKGMSQTPVFQKRLDAAGGDILALFATYKSRDAKVTVPTATEQSPLNMEHPAMERLAAIMKAAAKEQQAPMVIEPVIEVPKVVALVEPIIEVPEVVAEEETPKERRNRLRREKAAQEKARREERIAEENAVA